MAIVLKAVAVRKQHQLNMLISIIFHLIYCFLLGTSRTKQLLLEFPDSCAGLSTSNIDYILNKQFNKQLSFLNLEGDFSLATRFKSKTKLSSLSPQPKDQVIKPITIMCASQNCSAVSVWTSTHSH